MAPLMSAVVVAAALFFAVVALVRFGALESRLTADRGPPPVIEWAGDQRPASISEQLEVANSIARYELEREIIARRYETAQLAFTARLWTRFMGFMTGMILALVGAVFVLGKLDSEASELDAKSPGLALSMKSASPGLVLATLGTLLMAMSILVPATADTNDGAVYLLPPPAGPGPEPSMTSAMPGSDEPPLRNEETSQ
jgi:hypothetical protein